MATQTDLATAAFGAFTRKPVKEQVTPHKMSILVLVQEYCTLKNQKSNESRFVSEALDKEKLQAIQFTEKEKRNFMVTILQLLQVSYPTLHDLCLTVKKNMKTELYDVFCKRLQEFIEEGVGAIKDYFQNINFLLMSENQDQPIITKSSVLGLFIRRMTLEFEKLTFSQVTDLHAKFQCYYNAGTVQGGLEESQEFGESLTDSVMSLSGIRFSKSARSQDPFQLTADRKLANEAGGFNSQKQAEYFILQQGFLLQHNENEAMLPTELQDRIQLMLKANPDMAEAHFLSYLNSLRVKEYCTTFHNLFHYFDRNTAVVGEQVSATHTQNRTARDEKVCRRYGALNLAALHYRFGHRQHAMAALQEAISQAQESNDDICLQHALGWLHMLGEQGTARTENLLESAVTKSSELNLPNLTSKGIQAFARHNAFAAAKPSSVFEDLQKSDILNCQHSQSGFMCTSYAGKAALWQMYGKSECTNMMSQLILNLDTLEGGVYFNGESVCIALCNMARLHADCGQYSMALDLVNNAKKRFPSNSQNAHIWMSTEQEILYDRTILNRKLGIAEQAVLNLHALNNAEADLRVAVLRKEKGEVTEALSQLHKLLDFAYKEHRGHSVSPDFTCRVLLALAELYTETGNPTNATTYVLGCINYAKHHHLQYQVSIGCVQLAYIQFQMLLPDQAMNLLTQNILTVLTHGRVYDRARILYFYAKCQVSRAHKLCEANRKAALLSSVSLMNAVIEGFQGVEAYLRVKDALHYQARLYHELAYTKERNKCAHQFHVLDSQYPTLSKMVVNSL